MKVLQHKTAVTPQGRVQRLFGIWIPLKKIPKPKKYLTLRFCLTGVIPSKKNDFYSENNVRFVIPAAKKAHGFTDQAFKYIRDHTKSWLRGSERYLKWCEDITVVVNDQAQFWAKKYDLIYPLDNVTIKCTYYFADTRVLDLISKDESVYDMLVKKGILLDDNYGVIHKTTSEGYCCKGEIVENVCVVDVTYMIF